MRVQRRYRRFLTSLALLAFVGTAGCVSENKKEQDFIDFVQYPKKTPAEAQLQRGRRNLAGSYIRQVTAHNDEEERQANRDMVDSYWEMVEGENRVNAQARYHDRERRVFQEAQQRQTAASIEFSRKAPIIYGSEGGGGNGGGGGD
ncbi:MAG: hypothetical protein KDJ69_14530 [Nitratireductor sp.]|nr:hypothetical protein [Nitratireductor sp.]